MDAPNPFKAAEKVKDKQIQSFIDSLTKQMEKSIITTPNFSPKVYLNPVKLEYHLLLTGRIQLLVDFVVKLLMILQK